MKNIVKQNGENDNVISSQAYMTLKIHHLLSMQKISDPNVEKRAS